MTAEELFRDAAAAYCAWTESPTASPAVEARRVLHLLAELYAAALQLPSLPPAGQDVTEAEVTDAQWRAVHERCAALPIGYYSVVAETHVVPTDEVWVGDLADDLADIYRDLKNGLNLWRAGHRMEAVWDWRFHFQFHWGRHAVDAMRALHVWLEEECEL